MVIQSTLKWYYINSAIKLRTPLIQDSFEKLLLIGCIVMGISSPLSPP